MCIFTGNTDTFTNPTLLALIQHLELKNIGLLLFGPRQTPGKPRHGHNIRTCRFPSRDASSVPALRKIAFWVLVGCVKLFLLARRNAVLCVIGIDPPGLIKATRMSRMLKKPLGYLSFEILSKDECHKDPFLRTLKVRERDCCRKVSFVVVQDETRLALLKMENSFEDTCTYFMIPVAPSRIDIPQKKKPQALTPTFKPTVVYSGSIGTWCGTDRLLDLVERDSEMCTMVIHSRFKLSDEDPFATRMRRMEARGLNIQFHNEPFSNQRDYFEFLSRHDIALALYFPDKTTGGYLGRNIEEIGLASGKFSTYMMLGIPTITTRNTLFVRLKERYDFGEVVSDVSDIAAAAGRIVGNYEKKRLDALRLYDEMLDADKRIQPLVGWIEAYQRDVG